MTKHQKQQEEEIDLTEQETPETAESEQPAEETAESPDGKVKELEAEIEKLKDLYMRSQAEMENLRRRTQIELEKRSKFAISSFAHDLLPVNDNLSRAMDSIPQEIRDEQPELIKNLIVGLELTQKDLISALEKNNIKPVESIGHVFDPNLHKVVQEVEDPTKPAGTIIQEWQKGYTIGGDRVLREAVVVVTKGGPKPGEDPVEHVDTTA